MAGHLSQTGTARSAFPAVVLNPAGPYREGGKNALERRDFPVPPDRRRPVPSVVGLRPDEPSSGRLATVARVVPGLGCGHGAGMR